MAEEPKTTPVLAPMVGKIVNVLAEVGSQVAENDKVLTLEAMKIEMPVVAPVSGKVKEIKVSPGQVVEADTVLAVIE